MVLCAGQDQDILFYLFRVKVLFIEPEEHIHGLHGSTGFCNILGLTHLVSTERSKS
jgi:hypothetical protein